MKNLFNPCVFIAGLCMITILYACKKDGTVSGVKPVSTVSTVNAVRVVNFEPTILVADTDGFNAAHIDTNLRNPWGMDFGVIGLYSQGEYILSKSKGLSTAYDKMGNNLQRPGIIPAATAGQTGSPTGVVFNNASRCFSIPSRGQLTRFIMCTEDGLIIAEPFGGGEEVIVSNQSARGAAYTGLTIGEDHGSKFLFATNFRGGTIDVFDDDFHYMTKRQFKDPNIPSDYGPFNIRYIDGLLYVTYAKRLPPDNKEDEKGAGNGYVDVFNTNGTLNKHLISKGMLNSPWGIAKENNEIGGQLLIGNSGDGKINVYGQDGSFRYQLQNNGTVITIPGLRALDFLAISDINFDYPLGFTAGPNNGLHGLFGYLQRTSPF